MSSQKDFSLFSLFTAGLACMIPFASAYTQPVGDSPEGNPISQPGLNSVVPVGESFSVTWQPTTKGTVSLVLLKGPSSNAVPQYAIAEKIPNNGLFAWTPKTDLAPTDNAEGYGIQLIDDATGQYQYTTQFGISNPNYDASAASSSSSSVVASATSSWSGPPHGHGPVSGSWGSDAWSTGTWSTDSAWSTATWTTSTSASGKPIVPANSTWPAVTAPITTGVSPSGAPTGVANVTMVAPTGALTSLKTSATLSSASATSPSATAAPTHSNAANSMATSFAGLVVAGAVAVFAL